MSGNSPEKIAKDILWMRLAQMMVNEEHKAEKFKVPVHLALGHEAIAVAVDRIMDQNDSLVLSHRNIAYNLARLGKLKPVMDEYFLKPGGLAGGRLGSMNLSNPSKGIIYSSSILGNNFSVASGLALGKQIVSSGGLTIVLGGDGSIEEGSFYESLLILRSLNLSCFVVIEDNDWSLATQVKERRSKIDLFSCSGSLGIKYAHLEGNDPIGYIEELSRLKRISLEDKAPVCIEVKVSTLGDWTGPKSTEHPDGKFINYHAGPSPSASLSAWPILKENKEDPIFVLKKYFKESELKDFAKAELNKLRSEIYHEICRAYK